MPFEIFAESHNLFENIFHLLVIVLASYRLTIMILEEDGFLGLTFAIRLIGMEVEGISRYRAWRLSWYNDSWELQPRPVGHLGRLLTCFYCLSVWVALIVPFSYTYLHETIFVYVYYALAISAIGIFLEKWRD